MFVIAVYVDDILLAGKTDKRIAEVKKALSECFKVRDMGKLYTLFPWGQGGTEL